MLSRRHFLKLSGSLAAAGFTMPMWLRSGSMFGVEDAVAASNRRKLLVMLLAGGNDGLNTVIPYGLGDYYSKRQVNLAYQPSEVLHLGNSNMVGLHPNLTNLKGMYDVGEVAIVQAVGYDKPDLSHFGSMDIWQTGSPAHDMGSGWLGRFLDQTPDNGSVVRAAAIGDYLPGALIGESKSGVALTSFNGFTFYDGADANPASAAYRLHQSFLKCADAHPNDSVANALLGSDRATVNAVRAIQSLGQASDPPPSSLADQVSMALKLLSSNLGVDVAFVTIGSFDDHASEKQPHADLLKEVDNAIGRFRDDVARTGHANDYLLMTFSEFGRRVEENGSGGTDHGTAAPLFVVGGGVRGGLYGEHPAIDTPHLDSNGNMIPKVDFREVYAPILDRWLGADSRSILKYDSRSGLHPLAFLK